MGGGQYQSRPEPKGKGGQSEVDGTGKSRSGYGQPAGKPTQQASHQKGSQPLHEKGKGKPAQQQERGLGAAGQSPFDGLGLDDLVLKAEAALNNLLPPELESRLAALREISLVAKAIAV